MKSLPRQDSELVASRRRPVLRFAATHGVHGEQHQVLPGAISSQARRSAQRDGGPSALSKMGSLRKEIT
jgi:hypothetical protein